MAIKLPELDDKTQADLLEEARITEPDRVHVAFQIGFGRVHGHDRQKIWLIRGFGLEQKITDQVIITLHWRLPLPAWL